MKRSGFGNELKLNEVVDVVPLDMLRAPFWQLVLPTEVVLTSLVPPVPTFARAYGTDLFVPFETFEVLNFEELHSRFNGSRWRGSLSVAERARLLEWFGNEGDDGHTDMLLHGWVLVRESQLKLTFYTDYDNPLRTAIGRGC